MEDEAPQEGSQDYRPASQSKLGPKESSMNLYHNADFNAIHKEVQKLTQAAELGLAKNRHSAFAYGFEAKTEIKRSSTKLKTKNSNSSQNIFQHEPSKVYNPTKKLTSSTNNPNERHL